MAPAVFYLGYVLLCTQTSLADDLYTCTGHDTNEALSLGSLSRSDALDAVALCQQTDPNTCSISPP